MELFQREISLKEESPANLLMHVNKFLERIHAMSSLTIDDLKQAILNDPVLKVALTGPSGDLIQNYGGSLLKNGALELGIDGWDNGVLDGYNNGLKVLKTAVSSKNTNSFYIENTSLYKIKCSIKIPLGSAHIELFCLDGNGNPVTKSNNSSWSYPSNLVSNSNGFTTITSYLGGVGNLSMNFPSNCANVKASFIIWGNSSGFAWLNGLTIEKVSLGEPVPFNLPYLPAGQMVFDTTDGSVGRWDGTAFTWFATV